MFSASILSILRTDNSIVVTVAGILRDECQSCVLLLVFFIMLLFCLELCYYGINITSKL